MIEAAVKNWLTWAKGEMPGNRAETLDTLLADDVTFYSPVVFTPQKGKTVTKLYLMAAFGVFGEGDGEEDGEQGEERKGSGESADAEGNDFRYSKMVMSGHHAVLEFETTMGGKYVNGVDIITYNDDGKITDFKVMVRPLQAINQLHAQMGAMLKKLQGDG